MSVLIVARDVSERATLERTLLARADQLEAAGSQKEEFPHQLSHRARCTPLNAILGWASLLQRSGGGQDQSDMAPT